MKRILLLQLFLFSAFGFAQVGVNTTTPHPSSMLDVTATNKGALFPRVSLSNINLTTLDGTNTAATGLLIWNTNAATTGGNGVGYYFFNGTIWVPVMQTASSDHDWYEVGGTNPPNAITDNIYKQGTLSIGSNLAATGVVDIETSTRTTNLDLTNTNATNPVGININTNSTSGNKTGINVSHSGTNAGAGGLSSIIYSSDTTVGDHGRYAMYNFMGGASFSMFSQSTGIYNFFSGAAFPGIITGIRNQDLTTSNGARYGMSNTFSGTGNGDHYGLYNYLSGTGTGTKYGVYSAIDSAGGGTHYGIYSSATSLTGYAGYFLGRMSIGTTAVNNYILPSSRGVANQIMQTDGIGNVSWVNASTIDTDDQIIDVLSLTGTTLNVSLQNDGVATQTVNLASLDTDNQIIDALSLTGDVLNISLQDDGVAPLTLNLATIDNQATDVFSLTGTTLNLSLQNDGVATQTVDLSSLAGDDDWTDVGADIERQAGNVYIGDTSATNNNLYISNQIIDWDNVTYTIDPNGDSVMNEIQFDNGTFADPSIRFSEVNTGFFSPANDVFAYSANGTEAFRIHPSGNIVIGQTIDPDFRLSTSSLFGNNNVRIGNENPTDNVVEVDHGGQSGSGLEVNTSSSYTLASRSAISANNTFTTINVDLARFESGSLNLFGVKSILSDDLSGIEYGIYSEALQANGFAGYFLGRMSIGTTTANNYILPAARGTNGQIMQTNATGVVSWVNAPTAESTTANNGLTETVNNVQLGGPLVQNTTLTQGTFNMDINLNNTGDFSIQDNGTDVLFVEDTGEIGIGTNVPAYPLHMIENGAVDNAFFLDKTETSANNTSGIFINKTGQGTGRSHAIFTDVDGTGTGQKYGVFNQISSTAAGNQYGTRNFISGNSPSSQFGTFNNLDNAGTGIHYGNYNGMRGTSAATLYANYNEFDNVTTAANSYGNYTSFSANATGTGDKYGTYNIINTAIPGTHFGTFNSVGVANGWAGYFLGRNYISDREAIGETDNPNAGLSINKNSTGTYSHIELKEAGANDGARLTFSNTAEVTNNWLLYGRADNTITDSRFNIFHTTTGNIMQITGDGLVGILRAPTTNQLEINGTASKAAAGGFLANSDSRLKKNIATISPTEALEKVLSLRGVTYEWNDDKTGMNRPEGTQLGFVAQEIQQVFPEKVTEDKQGYLQTAYGDYDAIIFQAIKALNDKIEKLEKENEELKKLIRN